ncbi:MAG TPA: quinoprotein dehydrogenase-associated SoxYZ-like carrier [Gammaproteobacteria bacterium]
MQFPRFSSPACHALFLFLLAAAGPAAGAAEEVDFREAASEKVWSENLRPGFFQNRPINETTADAVLELKAPHRAEDATVVPISIHTRAEQSEARYIRRIHVFIDKNPLPLVGIFDFTPDSGRADLAMRVRVDDFSFVRAIAETSDGELHMVKSFVRATGACSAPPPKSIEDSIANMGAMRIRTVGELEFNRPTLVQLMIKHPNITGLQPMTLSSRVRPPAHFVKELRVDYDGTEVLRAQLTFSISMDPSFRFFFLPRAAGVMTVEAADTQDNHWTVTQQIPVPSPSA